MKPTSGTCSQMTVSKQGSLGDGSFFFSLLCCDSSQKSAPLPRGCWKRSTLPASRAFLPTVSAHQIRKNVDTLRRSGISVTFRKSNGERLICLRRGDGVDDSAATDIVPIDPAVVEQSDEGGAAGAGDADSSLRGGQASRPAIRHAQFRGAAPCPAPEGEKEEQCRE